MLTIEYVATPADVSALYAYCWKHSAYFKRGMIFYGILLGLLIIAISFSFQETIRKGDIIIALALAVAFPFAAPFIAKLRTKKDKRTLSIDSRGLHTQIGAMSGDVPWSKIVELFTTEEHIFILGRNLNGFSIPRDAFKSAGERQDFIRLCRDHPPADDDLPMLAPSIGKKFNLFIGRNGIYFWSVAGLCLMYGVSAILLPYTHGFTVRRIVVYIYAPSKVSILPVSYFWLILDGNKSLPWRNRPVVRHGTVAIILLLAFLYIRSLHSIDVGWAKMAFWGAFLSATLAFTEAITT